MFYLLRYLHRLWRERKARAAGAPGVAPDEQRGIAPGAAPGEPPGGAPDDHPASSGPLPASATRPPPATPRRSPASRGPVALFAHQVRYDLRASLRNPRARFFTFIFPIIMLVVFIGVFGHGSTTFNGVHVKLSRYFVCGILAMSIVVAAYANLVVSVAALRESGVLKRRRATPVAPGLLIAGQATTTVAIATVMGAILLVLAKLLYGIGIAPGAIAAIACTALVGTLVFACIGYAVSGLIGSPEAAQPIVQATMLPLWFISGVLIPTATLSATLRTVGSVFPVEHLAAGLHLASVNSSFSQAISGTDLLVLAAWGVGAAAFAIWRFSWLPSSSTT